MGLRGQRTRLCQCNGFQHVALVVIVVLLDHQPFCFWSALLHEQQQQQRLENQQELHLEEKENR